MKRKVVSYLIISMFIFSGIFILISTNNVSATALNCTWKPTSGVLASTAANWENGSVPATGDNIYFISSWTTSCTYDITTSVGAFNIRTGYSGTITQAASFSVTSYSQAAGVFTGSVSHWLTDLGAFTQSAGIISSNLLKLRMTGDDNSISVTTNGVYFSNVWVSGNTSVTSTGVDDGSGSEGVYANVLLQVDSGKTFTIASGKVFRLNANPVTFFTNSGMVTGPGSLMFFFYLDDTTATLGTINAPVDVYHYTAITSNRVFTIGAATILGSTLTVRSGHASAPMTLNLNGYSLSTAGITIGTRGIITAGTSTITDSGNWDSSASSNVASSLGTAKVHLTGVSKTFKQSSTERIGSLFVDTGSSYTLQSNIYSINYWLNGTVTKAGYTVYVNNDQTPSITSSAVTSCHFIDNYYYNVTALDQDETLTYNLTSSWPNVNINTTTGKIINVQPLANNTWSMNVSITDGNHTIYQNFNLNIWNYAPIFTTYAGYVLQLYDNYFYFANATDSEGYTIIFNCTFEGTWLVWNPTNHSLSGQAFEREIGYYDVYISAWDGYKTTWQNFTIKVEGPLTNMVMSFIIYFSLLLITFGIILVGYFKIPILLFFGIIISIALAIPIITSFRDYTIFGIIFILMNITVSIIGLSKTNRGK